MLRLSPPNFLRLEQAQSLDVRVGGAELNTAVGLARLGRSSAWVSRLPANPLGRLVANRAREAGVSTEYVVWSDGDRLGLYFVEFGAAPRPSSVLYDRKGAAVSAIWPGLVDWAKAFAGSKWFHVTGVTPALSMSAAETTREALQAARAAHVGVSIDLNYRAKLWNTAEAGRRRARRCWPAAGCGSAGEGKVTMTTPVRRLHLAPPYEGLKYWFTLPADAHTLDGFRRWAVPDDYPETGRVSYIAGEIFVDMSP